MSDETISRSRELRYWVVDPLDIDHVVKDLLVFGFPVRTLAEEEARELEGAERIYEVRITPMSVVE